MWLKLWLLCAFAEPAPKETGLNLWSDAQVTQREMPALNGRIESTRSQLEAKKLYFKGKGSLQLAFWNWDASTLFTKSSINLLRIGLLNQHQQRLSQFSEAFPFEDPSGEVAEQYVNAYTTLWQLENERDALDLRFIERLLTEVTKNSSLSAEFETLEDRLRLKIEEIVADPTLKEDVAVMVVEYQSLLDLRIVLIQHWTLHDSHDLHDNVLEAYAQTMLKQEVSLSASLNFLMESRYNRYKIVRSQLTENSEMVERIDTILNKYVASLTESRTLERLKLFEELKETWSVTVSTWNAETTDLQLRELEEQLQLTTEDDGPIQKQMLAFQLEVIRDHQSGQNQNGIEADFLRAQKELEVARQKELEVTQSEQSKRIYAEVTRLREIDMNMRAEESERHKNMQIQIKDGYAQLAKWNLAHDTWAKLPPLDVGRQDGLVNLRKELHFLQSTIQERIQLLDETPTFAQVSSTIQHADVTRVLSDIAVAEQDFIRHKNTEREILLQQWIDVHQHHKDIGYLDVDSEQFWMNVGFEWHNVPFILELQYHKIKQGLLDITQIVSMSKDVLKWSVFLVLWFWMRGRVKGVWNRFKRWVEQQDHPDFFGEFGVDVILRDAMMNESAVGSFLVSYIFDVLVALLLVFSIQEGVSVTFAYGILLMMTLRVCRPLVNYWIENEHLEESLLNGLYAFVVGLFGLNFLASIFEHILYTFQTIQLLLLVQFLSLCCLVVVQLGVWSQLLQGEADSTIGIVTLKSWMVQWSTGVIGKRIRAIIAISIILSDSFVRLLFWFVEHSSVLGSILARNAIDEDISDIKYPKQNTHNWNLDWDMILRFYVDLIHESITEEDSSLGAICLVADEGMGKSAVLQSVLNSSSEQTHLLAVKHIIRDDSWTSKTLLFWLCDELGLERTSTIDKLCVEIKNMPASIIGIDDVQRVFLRDVQGFEIINHLFAIIQSTSDRHRWILTCHFATWSFWESPSTPIRVDFFKAIHKMIPLPVSDVRTAMIKMCNTNNITLDFSMLSTIKNPQATHRAEMAYWRLLVDSTKGNPSTAMNVFCASLIQVSSNDSNESTTVGVEMFSLKQSEVLDSLDEGSGFIMACILLHNSCTLQEIVYSLDMDGDKVLSICRMLVSEKICTICDGRYQIDKVWYPWVQANLSEKRFIG